MALSRKMPVGKASGVPIDHAGRRVRCCGGDTGQLKRKRIDRSQVQVAAPEHDRVIRCSCVEVVAGQQPLLGPGGFVPALAFDPLAGRSGLSVLAQGLLHCGQ